jgi:hypothetical protein
MTIRSTPLLLSAFCGVRSIHVLSSLTSPGLALAHLRALGLGPVSASEPQPSSARAAVVDMSCTAVKDDPDDQSVAIFYLRCARLRCDTINNPGLGADEWALTISMKATTRARDVRCVCDGGI